MIKWLHLTGYEMLQVFMIINSIFYAELLTLHLIIHIVIAMQLIFCSSLFGN